MNAVKGIYKDGMIELIEKPKFPEPIEVLVVFPEKERRVKKIGGRFKDSQIDYDKLDEELKELSRKSEEHLLSELEDPQ
jgi:hypothetical protein